MRRPKKAEKAKKPAAKKPKRPTMQTHNGFGIVGPYGNMWTSQVFETRQAAMNYIKNFWSGIEHDTSSYRIVWARQAAYYLGEVTSQ